MHIILKHKNNFSIVPFERGSAVDIETDSLLLRNGSAIKVKWPRDLLVPSLKSIDIENSLIDIKLYERDFNSESRELTTLASNIPNTGETDVIIPDLSDVASEEICPVTIRVEVSTGTDLRKRRSIFDTLKLVFIWGKTYYQTFTAVSYSKCQEWVDSQPPGIGKKILDLVSKRYPCPPTLNRIKNLGSDFERDFFDYLLGSYFHPGAAACYRTRRFE